MIGRLDEVARPSGQRRAESFDRLARAREQRQVLAVEVAHPADDLLVDLLRRLRQAELVVQVPRPLVRAHSHHVPLGMLVPAPAALADELLARRVPDLLGVDQDNGT